MLTYADVCGMSHKLRMLEAHVRADPLTYADVCGRSDKLRTRLRVLEAHVRAEPVASPELSESEGQHTDKGLVQYVCPRPTIYGYIYRNGYESSCDYIGRLRRIRQHTSAYVSIHQHRIIYVSSYDYIGKDTLAYVSIRQHT